MNSKRSIYIFAIVIVFAVVNSYAASDFEVNGFGLQTNVPSLKAKFPKSEHRFVKGNLQEAGGHLVFIASQSIDDGYSFFNGHEKGILPKILTGSYSVSITESERQDMLYSVSFVLKENVVQTVDIITRESCKSMINKVQKVFGNPSKMRNYQEEVLPHRVNEWNLGSMSISVDCMLDDKNYIVDHVYLKNSAS